MGISIGWKRTWTDGWTKSFIASEGVFQPSQITGLVSWYDAQDLSTVTKDGSNLVSQWNDKASVPSNATQGTGTAQPTYTANQINGYPALVFDGTSDFLIIGQPTKLNFTPGTNAFSVCIIQKGVANVTGTIFGKAGLTSAQRQYQFPAQTNVLQPVIGGTADPFATTITGGTGNILIITVSTTASNLFVNGTADANNPNSIGTVTNSADVLIGARRNNDTNQFSTSFYSGALGELLVYNKVLDTTEQTLLRLYATTKWGI